MKSLFHKAVIHVPESRVDSQRMAYLMDLLGERAGGYNLSHSVGAYYSGPDEAQGEEEIILHTVWYNMHGADVEAVIAQIILHLLQQGEHAVFVEFDTIARLYYGSDKDMLAEGSL